MGKEPWSGWIRYDRRMDGYRSSMDEIKPKDRLCLWWLNCDFPGCPHRIPHKRVVACSEPCNSRQEMTEDCIQIDVPEEVMENGKGDD